MRLIAHIKVDNRGFYLFIIIYLFNYLFMLIENFQQIPFPHNFLSLNEMVNILRCLIFSQNFRVLYSTTKTLCKDIRTKVKHLKRLANSVTIIVKKKIPFQRQNKTCSDQRGLNS